MSEAAPPPRALAASVSLIVLYACAVTDELVRWAPVTLAGLAAYVTFVAVGWGRLNLIARSLAAAALASGVLCAVVLDRPAPALLRAAAAAVLLGAFIATINLLRDAAQSSDLVRRCGEHLLAQPPARRYAALTFGAHLFGVMTTFGVLNLLGVMIRRGNTLAAAGGDAALMHERARRSMMAVLRGFAHCAEWSPFSVPFALIVTGYPAVTWPGLVPYTLSTALLLVVVGCAVDAVGGRGRPQGPAALSERPPWTVHLFFALLILVLFAIVLSLDALLQRRIITAAIISVPVFAFAWIAAQYRGAGPLQTAALAAARARRIVRESFPGQTPEVTVLGSAGFIGAALGALLDPQAVAQTVGAVTSSPTAVLVAAAWLFFLLGHAGATPVVMASVLTAAIPDPGALGIPVEIFAVAILGAWGVTQQSTPFGLPVFMVAALSGRTPQTISFHWNLPYTLASMAVLSAWLIALEAAFG